jgi:hypothetical protein
MMRPLLRDKTLFFLPPPASSEAAVLLKGIDADD